MIEARGLVKRYGATVAVNDLSFSIRPGLVTGFLGPNGAGKTTTMRMILGLDAPTQGSVTVGGRSYRDLPAPMRQVGALLEDHELRLGDPVGQHGHVGRARLVVPAAGDERRHPDLVQPVCDVQSCRRPVTGPNSLGPHIVP